MNMKKAYKMTISTIIITLILITFLFSETSTVNASSSKPAKVTGLKVTDSTETTVNLSWKKAKGADRYVILRYVYSKDIYELQGVTSKNYCTVTSLPNATGCCFRVQAFNDEGYYGERSNLVNAVTSPLSPKINKLEMGDKSIKVSWGKVKGATSYEVWYSTSKSGNNFKEMKVSGNSATIKVDLNKTWYVKVVAYRTVKFSKCTLTSMSKPSRQITVGF